MTQIMPKFHLAFGGAWPFARLGEHRSPRGPSFCSCKRKQNRAKGNQAFPFANPFDAKLRLDTNDASASSVRRRRYAFKVPAAHFILDFAGTELKINLISVVASDATFA